MPSSAGLGPEPGQVQTDRLPRGRLSSPGKPALLQRKLPRSEPCLTRLAGCAPAFCVLREREREEGGRGGLNSTLGQGDGSCPHSWGKSMPGGTRGDT